jgi:hypothetical protein
MSIAAPPPAPTLALPLIHRPFCLIRYPLVGFILVDRRRCREQ